MYISERGVGGVERKRELYNNNIEREIERPELCFSTELIDCSLQTNR
jgi:hypothetical protein